MPTVIVCGPLFARYISGRATANPPQDLLDQVARQTHAENPPSFGVNPPSFGVRLFTILLPVAIHSSTDS